MKTSTLLLLYIYVQKYNIRKRHISSVLRACLSEWPCFARDESRTFILILRMRKKIKIYRLPTTAAFHDCERLCFRCRVGLCTNLPQRCQLQKAFVREIMGCKSGPAEILFCLPRETRLNFSPHHWWVVLQSCVAIVGWTFWRPTYFEMACRFPVKFQNS